MAILWNKKGFTHWGKVQSRYIDKANVISTESVFYQISVKLNKCLNRHFTLLYAKSTTFKNDTTAAISTMFQFIDKHLLHLCPLSNVSLYCWSLCTLVVKYSTISTLNATLDPSLLYGSCSIMLQLTCYVTVFVKISFLCGFGEMSHELPIVLSRVSLMCLCLFCVNLKFIYKTWHINFYLTRVDFIMAAGLPGLTIPSIPREQFSNR